MTTLATENLDLTVPDPLPETIYAERSNEAKIEDEIEIEETDSGTEEETEEPTATQCVTDYTSQNIHDEVELLLLANNTERMELIASAPKLYLDIVQNYNKMPDGKTVYLPDLFNIIVSRESGRLKIKFKMSDDTQWYDVGYEGGSFQDEDVYKAFTEKVNMVIRHPPPDRRAMLQNTLLPGGKPPAPIVNQGNQSKLTKIDRFFGRTSHAFDVDVDVDTNVEGANTADRYRRSTEERQPAAPCREPTVRSVVACPEPFSVKHHIEPELKTNDFLNTVVDSYKTQLKERLKEKLQYNTCSMFQQLVPLCPKSCKDEFSNLVALLSNDSQFVSKTLDVLPQLPPGKQHILLSFLQKHNKAHTHQELCDILNLSNKDRELLSQYKINLEYL